jgi:hypothetical protein
VPHAPDKLKDETYNRDTPNEPKQSPAPGASKYAKCERRIRARDQKEDGAVVKDLDTRLALFLANAW